MSTPTAPVVSPAPATPVHDLRTFFRAVGSNGYARALSTTPTERPETDTPVELLETAPSKVTAAPLPVAGFLDGIQAALCVTHIEHRPVYLAYCAAGAVAHGMRPLGVKEELFAVAAGLDREWFDGLGTTIPVEELISELPPDIERDAHRLLGTHRDGLERGLVSDLVMLGLVTDDAPLVVDGSLRGRPVTRSLVSVVKTTARKYLPDERVLFGLPAGWRSPLFKIPAGAAGNGVDLYSCYVRMFDASQAAWSFGLIRLETHDPQQLEPLAAMALGQRQGQGTGDARFDRHLAGVRATEDFLRARRPSVFN